MKRGDQPTASGMRALRRVLLGTLVCTIAAFVAAGSASAVVIQLESGRRVGYQPLRGGAARSLATPFAGKNLIYHGGPVMPSNNNYTFYWAPKGSAPYAAGYMEGIDTYLSGLAHDSGGEQNVDSVAAQYTDSGGERASYSSHFAGRIVDTDPYPLSGCVAATICLTDAQIQAELRTYIESHGLPADLTHEYFVLTPPGVESCFEANSKECSAGTATAAYCAFHSSFNAPAGLIIYANDPYVVGNEGCDDGHHPNESPADAALEGGLSHEHNESITDPELNAWFGPEGEENGDKCRTFVRSSEYGNPLGTAPDGSPYNQLVNGLEYWYQQEWSNEGSTCLQRRGETQIAPTVQKLAPKKGSPAGGATVTITGTGFVNVTNVDFGATPAGGVTVVSPTSITVTSPAGTPKTTVDVTVTTKAGTSALVKGDRFKYRNR